MPVLHLERVFGPLLSTCPLDSEGQNLAEVTADGHQVMKGWFGILSSWEEVWLPGSHQTGDVMGGDHTKMLREPHWPACGSQTRWWWHQIGEWKRLSPTSPGNCLALAMTIRTNRHRGFHLRPLRLDWFIRR